MSAALIVGGFLLLWVLADLLSGKVYLHRAFLRSQEPLSYWFVLALWLLVALSCFYIGEPI
ncbi:hypothetical protein A9Q81_15345 [Gammaproteobacteria bacterium 42_54_T18]|nr:hypothetical protein A9Q81_15345 [Gammaproteobacteria bacterium 42_54_T18]